MRQSATAGRFLPKTMVPECTWPALPPATGAQMLAVQQQLAQSERWPPEALRAQQFRQLLPLVRHAAKTVPHYREPLRDLPLDSPEALREAWPSTPILTRAGVQAAGENLRSRAIPPGHRKLNRIQTSGSTGRPVTAYGTDITRFFGHAFVLREHYWHGRDLGGTLVGIRPEGDTPLNTAVPADNWGPPATFVYETGPSYRISTRTSLADQARLLLETAPHYLSSLPSNLLALADYCAAEAIILPGLREVRTFGEALGDALRERCRTVWNAPVVDMYSTKEVGHIALQCSVHEHYHIQAENLLVEVLDDANQPCGPGEMGRVVVTTLHNFATPFIRYEIGDYARLGDGNACSCGRELPVIDRVLGRVRNMLLMPDGSKRLPSIPSALWAGTTPIRQLQLVQTHVDQILARAVATRPLTEAEERHLTKALNARFGLTFAMRFEYLTQIERSPGGKFEDFICRVGVPAARPGP